MEYTENQIRRAIAIAIKAKKLEENLIVYVEDDLGIEIKEKPTPRGEPSKFYNKLKTSVDKKREEVAKAKESALKAKWAEEDLERYEKTKERRGKRGWE